MKTHQKKSNFDQNKLKVLCDNLCDKIDELLDSFNLEYKTNNKFISMKCPIHDGDNTGALNLYHTGDSYRGNWICRTHGCEKIFKGSILGFIRGIISNIKYNWNKYGDQTCSFDEAVDYATKFLHISLKDITISRVSKDKINFVNSTKILIPEISTSPTGINRNAVISHLNIPSKYFLSRGFSSNILIKYDIGDCIADNKEMTGRAVVPIYDINHELMIGCSGRSINNKCPTCKSYHQYECPEKDNLWKYSKWKHSSGFKTQQCLYNYWYAKDIINECKSIIIVESPGNVWKLEENNIHNSVAIFGTSLSDKQKTLLDMSGAMELVIIMDSDDAGQKARDQIYQKCHRTYNIKNIFISKNDIADMTSEEIKNEIGNKL